MAFGTDNGLSSFKVRKIIGIMALGTLGDNRYYWAGKMGRMGILDTMALSSCAAATARGNAAVGQP